jgi:hypothetical protein
MEAQFGSARPWQADEANETLEVTADRLASAGLRIALARASR